MLGVGIVAAAMVSLDVVSLALACGLGDMTEARHDLGSGPRQAPVFHGGYAAYVLAAGRWWRSGGSRAGINGWSTPSPG